MGERYIIWGSQIGMLKAYLKHGQTRDAEILLDKIEERQFLFRKNGALHTALKSFMKLLDS